MQTEQKINQSLVPMRCSQCPLHVREKAAAAALGSSSVPIFGRRLECKPSSGATMNILNGGAHAANTVDV